MIRSAGHSWSHRTYTDAAGAEVARFANVVTGVDLDIQVPTCPGWTITELIRHTGGIHRWAEQMVRGLAQRGLRQHEVDLGLPADEAELPAWLDGMAERLVATFAAVDPDAPMWAWGPDKHARFWSRRVLHETTVHRADAELALGREPSIDADVSVDGIDEFLENLPRAARFAPNVKNLRGNGETLAVTCTNRDVRWLIRLRPEGFAWERGSGPATVSVLGQAADLLLLIYGRRRPTERRFERAGDGELLAFWLANSAI